MNKGLLIIGAIAVLSLTGCGQKDATSEVKVSENGTKTNVAYIKREALQPYEKYTPFKQIKQYKIGSEEHKKNMEAHRNFYWSSAPINYELLAYDYLDGYADETDTFKKKDIVKANKEKLDAIYQSIPKNKYFAVQGNGIMSYTKFNDQDKGFNLFLSAKEYMNDGDLAFQLAEKDVRNNRPNQLYYSISIAGQRNTEVDELKRRDNFLYIPKNEDEARTIEAELSEPDAQNNIKHVYLGRSIGARFDGNNTYSPIFMIDGISLVNQKTGKVIYTVDKTQLGDKYQIQCSSTAKALGLNEISSSSSEFCRGIFGD